MVFFKKKTKKDIKKINWKIKRSCLDLIIESSKTVYPNEFGGMLSVDEKNKTTISEIVILPGTVQGETHAIFKLHMMPVDFNIIGTVHSHPSHYADPSDADLNLFGKHGKIHIIIAYPYNYNSWKAYDYNGNEINITVI